MTTKTVSERPPRLMLWVVTIVVFVVAVLFSQLYQRGRKLLAGIYPWDTVLMVVFVVIAVIAAYYLQGKSK